MSVPYMSTEVNVTVHTIIEDFSGSASVKNLPDNAGDIRDVGSIFGSGRLPGGGHGNPLSILAWRIPWTRNLVGYSP